MLVSTRGRYAVRVMLELAQQDSQKFLRLDTIAEKQEISEKYLENIARVLVKAGMIEGMRGRGGGYRLTRKPETYSVGEILQEVEGTLAPVACVDCKAEKCSRQDRCMTYPMWEKLEKIISDYLYRVKLTDLLESGDDKM